jgi:glucose-1-phosphate thymidylyltransferase
MIYYPLSVLMLAGIRQILIISTPQDMQNFRNLFGDGGHLGLDISYTVQPQPLGIAHAFVIGEDFIGKDCVSLVLGDNIFYGDKLTILLKEAVSLKKGATVFAYYVKDPQRYGVVTFDQDSKVTSIVEKPQKPKSNWAVTGLYFYDRQVVEIAKKLKPSSRGELEITDINRIYLERDQLKVKLLGRGYAWLDTGTYDSLIDASIFIKTIEERQGLKIGCVEEIAYRMGFITGRHLTKLAQLIHTSYGDYLRDITKR